jgi:hypothetical protein
MFAAMTQSSTTVVLVALCVLLAPSPVLAGNPEGRLQICRTPGVVSIFDHQTIQLPAGTYFTDLADARDRSPAAGTDRPVELVLLEALTIPPGARCATVQAAVFNNPRGFPVGPNEHRAYHFSGHFHGEMPEMVGQAQTDFR